MEDEDCFEEKTVKNNHTYLGKQYWVNLQNGKSQWGVPLISGETLPFGWEKHMSKSNKLKPYYENIKTGQTQWTIPDKSEELPIFSAEWKMQRSTKCDTIYYKNIRTGTSQWDIPVIPVKPVKPVLSPLHMIQPDITDDINQTSNPWYDLIGMLWLLYNHPKECVVIPKGLLTDSGKLSLPHNLISEWSQTSLDWNDKSKLFVVPSGFWESVKDCLKKNSEFIVIPMGFNCADNMGHQNFLIYNTKTKEMERFEPNGSGIRNPCLQNPKMIPQLIDLFHKNVEKGMIKSFYEPLDFCPAKSFQIIQDSDGHADKTEKGYCLAWSYWYADTRLRNPNKTRKQVIDMALATLYANKSLSFTSFIRSFSNFLAKVGNEMKLSGDPAAVFKNYILKNT
jgi:hypothetical protein